jgi:hypothetical protein
MSIGWRVTWVACLHAASAFAAATDCRACHPAESARQALSAHASALYRTAAHPLAGSFPVDGKLNRKPDYRFEFFRSGGELRTRIRDKVDVMELPMQWAFGAGRQAVTFVSTVNKDWYVEHYASYYTALRSWGPTPGQNMIHPTSLPEAAGVVYKIKDPETGIAGCFECHTTGPVAFSPSGDVEIAEAGVRCEACHGPGAEHAQHPSRKNIRNPAALSAAQLNEFCGRCHRPPAAKGVTIDWNYAWNVRHQPVYLSESVCFRRSSGALSCWTCHDPHEPAGKHEAAYYNDRCKSCHEAQRQKPGNCIDCHMPLVSPQPPLRFTNHWIGIYRGGSNLKPVR